ncbi:MAG: hypothetical protein ACTTKL_06550 [Treponema sp.]
MKDKKFAYFQKKIIEHLEGLEAKELRNIKKSLREAETLVKAGLPIGTIRTWKGKKFIKIAQGKWKPKYDGETKGAKMAIAALKKKAQNCTDSKQLMQLVLENRSRFSDDSGRPLPFVQELSAYISDLNENIERGKRGKTAGADGNNTKEAQISDTQKNITEKIEQWKKTGRKIVKDERGLYFYEGMTPSEKIEWIENEIEKLKESNKYYDSYEFIHSGTYAGTREYYSNGGDKERLGQYLTKQQNERQKFGKKKIKENEDLMKVYKTDIDYYAEQREAKDKEKFENSNINGKDNSYPETNYPEYKGAGQKAVDFIVKQKDGQVRGAFHRPEIGDIDVVWGKVTDAQKHKGYGLSHIIDKHGIEIVNKIEEIINNGKIIIQANGIATIFYKDFKLGLSKGWKGKGNNHWILTAYQKGKDTGKTFDAAGQGSEAALSKIPNQTIPENTKTGNKNLDGKKKGKSNLDFSVKKSYPFRGIEPPKLRCRFDSRGRLLFKKSCG